MKKPLKIIIILLVIAAVAGAKWWQSQASGPGDDPLTLYGNIEIRDARLVFNEAEILKEVLVEEGDVVTKGQVLARLRSQLLQDQKAAAEANLAAQAQVVQRLKAGTRSQEIAQAKSEVEAAAIMMNNAERIFKRLRQTTPSGASSQQALDDARARYESAAAELEVRRQALALALAGPRAEDIAEAEARLAALAAEVTRLNHRLDDTILKAPAPGIIQSRILEPGEMAGPSQPVYSLALTDPKWVRAYISEPDLGHLDQGRGATVSCDSWPQQGFSGQVGFISPVAEFTPQPVETTDLRAKLVYEVRILVQDPDNRLKLGMPVTVKLAPAAPAPPAGGKSAVSGREDN
ncbi:MAG: efflux RND transporter periplasmic adaptor subunit [Deltaproteobacteria bacterium]|nr:efflux RND transporter periplasmic adaptor subunit [Deltaproteobacteria bacterium]